MRNETQRHLLLFRVADRRLAVPLDTVRHVVRAAAVTPVAGTPPDALGVVGVAGSTVPVLSLRPLLGLAPRALSPDDRFVLLRGDGGDWALVADRVEEVVPEKAGAFAPCPIPAHLAIRGLCAAPEGTILLCDEAALAAEAAAVARLAATPERGVER